MIPIDDTIEEEELHNSGNSGRRRPSHKELTGKIENAKKALNEKKGMFATSKFVNELMELEIGNSADVWSLISDLLKEIDPSDYAGGRPPDKSYESKIKGKELIAFAWNSQKLSKRMYLKYVLIDDYFYYISLHKDK